MTDITFISAPTALTRHNWNLTLYAYEVQAVQILTTAFKHWRHKFCHDFLQLLWQYSATFASSLVMKFISTSMGS